MAAFSASVIRTSTGQSSFIIQSTRISSYGHSLATDHVACLPRKYPQKKDRLFMCLHIRSKDRRSANRCASSCRSIGPPGFGYFTEFLAHQAEVPLQAMHVPYFPVSAWIVSPQLPYRKPEFVFLQLSSWIVTSPNRHTHMHQELCTHNTGLRKTLHSSDQLPLKIPWISANTDPVDGGNFTFSNALSISVVWNDYHSPAEQV